MINTQKIKQILKTRNISQLNLAEGCGISEQTIVKFLQGGNTRTETLEKVANYLDLPISFFFDRNRDTEYIKDNILQDNPGSKNENAYLAENIILRDELKVMKGKIEALQSENNKLKDKIIKLLER